MHFLPDVPSALGPSLGQQPGHGGLPLGTQSRAPAAPPAAPTTGAAVAAALRVSGSRAACRQRHGTALQRNGGGPGLRGPLWPRCRKATRAARRRRCRAAVAALLAGVIAVGRKRALQVSSAAMSVCLSATAVHVCMLPCKPLLPPRAVDPAAVWTCCSVELRCSALQPPLQHTLHWLAAAHDIGHEWSTAEAQHRNNGSSENKTH